MNRGAKWPFPAFGRRKRRGSEFVAVAAEDNNAYPVAASADVPHGVEDDLALVEVAGPGVGGAETPVAGEGDGRSDDFPFYARGFWAREEGEQ